MRTAAVIGCGGIGRRHAECYREDPSVQLVAVCDVMADRAKALAAEMGVKAYTSAEEMLAAEQPDVVSVCTSGKENGGDHFAPTLAALQAGAHVLVEKPISNSLVEAREMVAVARSRGRKLAVNLNHRFVPAAETARAWIQEGRIGTPLLVHMNLWIRNANESSPYFHLRALHSHSIDVMRYFCGDVARVQAFLSKAPGRSIWSNCSINMEFENGCIGSLHGSYDMSAHHPIERCEVAGTAGRFVLDNVYEELTLFPHDRPERTVLRNSIFGGVRGFEDTFARRIRAFLSQLDGDRVEGSGEDGLAALAVIEAAIRSHEEGRVVAVREVLEG